MKKRVINKELFVFNFAPADRVKAKDAPKDKGTVTGVNGVYINVRWDDEVGDRRGEVYLANQLERL